MSTIFSKYERKIPDNSMQLIKDYGLNIEYPIASNKNYKFSDIMYNLKKDEKLLSSQDYLMEKLRIAKKQLYNLNLINNINSKWNSETAMRNLSIFADFCIETSLKFLIKKHFSNNEILCADSNKAGITIIANGKLASLEIEYLNEVELIFIYDKKKSSYIKNNNHDKFFIKIAQDIIFILSNLTKDGYIFKINSKIKINNENSISIADIHKSKDYFTNFGQSWDKITMINSRYITGDIDIAEDFMTFIDNWIWKQKLNDREVNSLISFKNHNIFNLDDDEKEYIDIRKDSYYLDDIELFIKTYQLVNQTDSDKIKTANTLHTLENLADKNILDKNDSDKLRNIYKFLIDIETTIPYIEDKAISKIYKDKLEELASFMGYESKNDIIYYLVKAQLEVKRIFKNNQPNNNNLNTNTSKPFLFLANSNDSETIKELSAMGFNHSAKVITSLQNWIYGRYSCTKKEKYKYAITESLSFILEVISQSYNPDNSFTRFDRLLQKLDEDSELMQNFIKDKEFLKLVINLLGTTTAIASYIEDNVNLLTDSNYKKLFKRPQSLKELNAELGELLKRYISYSDKLKILYEFVNKHKVLATIYSFQNNIDIIDISKYMADIAESALTSILPYIHKDFEREYGTLENGEFALIAIGSLGAKQLSLNSDIDFIPIYYLPNCKVKSNGNIQLSPEDYYIKLTQKIINDISATEYKIYEIDPRIRPEGDKGPIASKLNNFINYQMSNEHSWEYISIIKSRILSKDTNIKKLIKTEIDKIITTPKDITLLKRYMHRERNNIKDRFKDKTKSDIKYIDGGLLDITFITKYLVLANNAIDANDNNPIISIEKAVTYKLIRRSKARTLLAAYKLFQKINFFLKLIDSKASENEILHSAAEKLICRHILGEDFAYSLQDLQEKIYSLSSKVSKIYEETFLSNNE